MAYMNHDEKIHKVKALYKKNLKTALFNCLTFESENILFTLHIPQTFLKTLWMLFPDCFDQRTTRPFPLRNPMQRPI